jgi:hypothetical protein
LSSLPPAMPAIADAIFLSITATAEVNPLPPIRLPSSNMSTFTSTIFMASSSAANAMFSLCSCRGIGGDDYYAISTKDDARSRGIDNFFPRLLSGGRLCWPALSFGEFSRHAARRKRCLFFSHSSSRLSISDSSPSYTSSGISQSRLRSNRLALRALRRHCTFLHI